MSHLILRKWSINSQVNPPKNSKIKKFLAQIGIQVIYSAFDVVALFRCYSNFPPSLSEKKKRKPIKRKRKFRMKEKSESDDDDIFDDDDIDDE